MSDDEIIDAVREAGLDWHAGYPVGDEANRYETLARAVEARVREKMGAGWIACNERMPEADTPVLVYIRGRVRTGELRWETPTYEETFAPYMYWDDPDDDGQMWEWDDVTHWRPLPPAPEGAGEKR